MLSFRHNPTSTNSDWDGTHTLRCPLTRYLRISKNIVLRLLEAFSPRGDSDPGRMSIGFPFNEITNGAAQVDIDQVVETGTGSYLTRTASHLAHWGSTCLPASTSCNVRLPMVGSHPESASPLPCRQEKSRSHCARGLIRKSPCATTEVWEPPPVATERVGTSHWEVISESSQFVLPATLGPSFLPSFFTRAHFRRRCAGTAIPARFSAP
ncbi:hypothetical protein EDB87DRAFT_945161 [Lactarius vividus]|nr:hypothetical protein EDB87DRAFT_945161 [Lactarius vividus]